MKGFLKGNDGPRWITLLLILYACYMVFHVLFYVVGNGMCAGAGTGLIHGSPAAGAGALPRITELENYRRLRPSRPWLSWSDLLAFCFVAAGCMWLGVAILRVLFIKKKIALLRKMLMILVLMAVTFLVSSVEQATSCSLRNTHANIEAVFRAFVTRANGWRGENQSIEIKQINVEISTNGRYLYELEGHSGEPTCGAYVILQPSNFASISAGSFNSYLVWTELSKESINTNPSLNYIFSKRLHLSERRSPIYVSVKQMEIDLTRRLTGKFSSDRYYSAIVCSEWPYGWLNEIE